MKGLEGVSDSDFHGWTVPRYGADAKEQRRRWRREPRRPWATEYIYMRGRERTEQTAMTRLNQREQVISKAGPGHK